MGNNMIPVNEIINKIKWDKTECMEDYIVGYWDRIENKIIFIKFKEFEKSDIPYHRIRVIKKNDKIVWNR
ncbi:MAG: DUF504 domain-containing protein [Candidatus Aenigmarchaeota archaeon]|nr:DUF504 domain-containing protein [Candidatus Aenigmarchaeota archaeon]